MATGITNTVDMAGNQVVATVLSVGTASPGSTAGTTNIYSSSGVPSFTAPKGSLYINNTATTTTTRLYINTDGAATWATFTTSA